jgi:PAS domain S-box-containing protein
VGISVKDKHVLPLNNVQSSSVLAEYSILDTAAETGYDDIATLAAQICGTPVAYVSFIDNNRQWFKAKLGFEMAENTLDNSFCLHTLRQNEMLVIPDLVCDPRTEQNKLVTGDPRLRFYAGTLLKTPEDIVLGTLCVMDVNPHPNGLTSEQQKAMLALTRQVMELLELRRTVLERDSARVELLASEQRYRSVFESAVDYAIVVMDQNGIITDWNEGAVRIFGWTRDEIRGSSINAFFTPEDIEASIPQFEMDTALLQGRGADERWHVRKSGERFWANGEMMPLQEINGNTTGFVKILRDKTKQREIDGQTNALFELSEKLRTAHTSDDALDAAVTVLKKHVAFDRAGFGRIDALGQVIDIEDSWCADNVPQFVGSIRFSDLGENGSRVARGEVHVVEDFEEVALSSKSRDRFKAFKLRAAIHVPLMQNGEPIAVFSVNSQHRRNWTSYEIDLVRAIADRTHAALARIEAEAQQQILNGELSHRLKNTLAMVHGIANQTLRGIPDTRALHAFEQRLLALGAAHDILFQHDWAAGKIHSLVSATLALHADKSQFTMKGPDIELGPTAAVSLSLLLHELATNAVKHGALSYASGKVTVSWELSGNGNDQFLKLSWRERGGPPVSEPTEKGFGSRLIGNGLAGTKQVQLNYHARGFEAEFQAPLSVLRASNM